MERVHENRPTGNHQPPKRSRILSWHSGDYEELFIFISPCRFGAVWIVKEQGKVRHRDVVLSTTNTQTAFDLAFKAARVWTRRYTPAARLRFRSTSERAALFGNQHEAVRRRAA
jgi:hypothetical protein